MSIASYLAAAVALVGFVGGCAAAGIALRRMLVPVWAGSLAALGATVLAIAVATVIGESLGSGGVFSRWPLTAAAVGCGALSRLAARRWAPGPSAPAPSAAPPGSGGSSGIRAAVSTAPHGRVGPALAWRDVAWWGMALAAVAAAVAQAGVGLWQTLHTGPQHYDSLQYHLFFAATFAQTHDTAHLVLDNPAPFTSFYPLNDELLHGVGMALLGRDTLSLLLGFADMAAAYLAVWALTRPAGVAAAAIGLIGASYLLVTTGATAASGGLNDWHAALLLLASVAFVVRGRGADGRLPPGAACLAGAAAGLAAGTKLTALVPSVAVFLVVVMLARRRIRCAGLAAGFGLLGGAYWFARDAIVVHNPLPEIDLAIGGHRLPRPPEPGLQHISFSVAHYFGDGQVLQRFYEPGLDRFFGPLWPLALVLLLAPPLLAMGSRRNGLGVTGFVGAVMIVAYLVTPTGAAGPPGSPTLFYFNIRYVLAGLLTSVVLLATLSAARWWRLVVAGVEVTLLGSVLGRQDSWPVDLRGPGAAAAIALIAVTGVSAAWLWAVRPPRAALVAGLACASALLAAGYPVQQSYLRHRYTQNGEFGLSYHVLGRLSGQRIGIVGEAFSYPLMGAAFTNTVRYVGKPAPDHGVTNITSCPAWRRALTVGRYRYLAVMRFAHARWPGQLRWTLSDPGARVIARNGFTAVFKLPPTSSQDGCGPSGGAR